MHEENTELMTKCNSTTTDEDVLKIIGTTAVESTNGVVSNFFSYLSLFDAAKSSTSCSRYTGSCSSASQCRDVCYRCGERLAWLYHDISGMASTSMPGTPPSTSAAATALMSARYCQDVN